MDYRTVGSTALAAIASVPQSGTSPATCLLQVGAARHSPAGRARGQSDALLACVSACGGGRGSRRALCPHPGRGRPGGRAAPGSAGRRRVRPRHIMARWRATPDRPCRPPRTAPSPFCGPGPRERSSRCGAHVVVQEEAPDRPLGARGHRSDPPGRTGNGNCSDGAVRRRAAGCGAALCRPGGAGAGDCLLGILFPRRRSGGCRGSCCGACSWRWPSTARAMTRRAWPIRSCAWPP